MKRRGVTLLELLVSSILAAAITSALSMAFSVAAKHQQTYARPRVEAELRTYFEDRIRALVSRALLSPDDADTVTVFRTDTDSQGDGASDRLTFTIEGQRWNYGAMDDSSTDFESRNETWGPVGGLTEVSIGTTAQGEAGSRTGLFVRSQTPADSDHEQGGYEQVLDDQVASVSFEVLDETGNWTASWDSSTSRTLPTGVKVSYTLLDDPDTVRSFVVRLRNATSQAVSP
ncbi:MAG: hypothetical protein JST30_07865 [Armatimonadetes bacterium]|nr:hypothetical protein [Armatimonadota bacterium]